MLTSRHDAVVRHTPMRLLAIAALAVMALGVAASGPTPVQAACGGPFVDDWLETNYNLRNADTVILARLTERDLNVGDYHFETLTVYRGGEVASPLTAARFVDVGVCIASVEPGWRFMYVSGDRERFGARALVFPDVPDYGWLIEKPDRYESLNGLLALVGVLPDTSTAPGIDTEGSVLGSHVGGVLAAFLTFAWLVVVPVRKRRSFGDE